MKREERFYGTLFKKFPARISQPGTACDIILHKHTPWLTVVLHMGNVVTKQYLFHAGIFSSWGTVAHNAHNRELISANVFQRTHSRTFALSLVFPHFFPFTMVLGYAVPKVKKLTVLKNKNKQPVLANVIGNDVPKSLFILRITLKPNCPHVVQHPSTLQFNAKACPQMGLKVEGEGDVKWGNHTNAIFSRRKWDFWRTLHPSIPRELQHFGSKTQFNSS